MLSEKENQLVLLQFDGHVATVTLNNPPANVLSQSLIDQLSQTFHELENVPAAAVIISGQGNYSFCAGADIREMTENDSNQNQLYFSQIYDTLKLIASCKHPVIAAVNGYAFGAGLELALCADIRVMDQNAQMSASGVNLNLVFCTQRLQRLIGPGRASDMLLSARQVNASQALEFGLVEHLARPGTAVDQAREIAAQISQKGQMAVQSVKQLITQGIDLPLDQALDLEAESIYKMFATREFERRTKLFLSR